MILKQLNNSNSMRTQGGGSAAGMCTQHSISGYSIMSQSTLGLRSNPQRHFDLLTLEIIGLLRKCFSQSLEIKCTLYENLQRAVELNNKLAPHVLQFIDFHFRSYFNANLPDITTTTSIIDEEDVLEEFSIKWSNLVKASDEQEQEITVYDNLGRLILFVSHCLVIYGKCEQFYSIREIERLLNTSVDKILAKELQLEDTTSTFTHLKCELLVQQANFIESLMAYVLLTSKQTNDNVNNLAALFREHQRIVEALKKASNSTKGKKKKQNDDSEIHHNNATINGIVAKRMNTQVENIWDLEVVERFLRLLLEDIVPFAASHNTAALRSNCELVRYVLKVAAHKVECIREEPEYKQVTHSKRVLRYLMDITKVVYERCIKNLLVLWRDFDGKTAALAAECFKQCLITANTVYKKKFESEFMKGFDFHAYNKCKEAPAILHDIIDELMLEQITDDNTTINEDIDLERTPIILLHCLEVLYENISYSNRLAIESYSWLMKFCKTYEVNKKDLGYVHKLLFLQRQKTHSGAFFNTIALHLGKVYGTIETNEESNNDEESDNQMTFTLKSITTGCVESCLNYLYDTLRKQIQDVEYYVSKANNQTYQYRLLHDEEREMSVASLRALERSICSQLVHISNALLSLTNVTIPLGNCMDSMIKLVMQFYVCLKNLSKHLLNCCTLMTLCIQNTKFDILLRVVGKKLPSNIYSLISYIEANIFPEEDGNKRKANPKADKAKVLRETKLIPKLILHVETFNKHVILLSKKTDDRLSAMLHLGVVRDFRIRSSDLKDAIERTLSRSDQIEELENNESGEIGVDDVARRDHDDNETVVDPDELAEMAAEHDDVENDSNELNEPVEPVQENRKSLPQKSSKTEKRKRNTTAAEKKLESKPLLSSGGSNLSEENVENTEIQVLKNLAEINKKARKRVLRNSSQADFGMIAPPLEPQPKKRRGRTTKAK